MRFLGAQFEGENGSAGTPVFSFASDPDTGMYRRGSNQLGFSAGGVEAMYAHDSGVMFVGTAQFNTTLSLGNNAPLYGRLADDSSAGILAYRDPSDVSVFGDGSYPTAIDGNGIQVNDELSLSVPTNFTDHHIRFIDNTTGLPISSIYQYQSTTDRQLVIHNPHSDAASGIEIRADNRYLRIRNGAQATFYDGTSEHSVWHAGNLRHQEGTWTPDVHASSTNPSVTYTVNGGYYLRVGSLVAVSAHITINTKSGGTGNARIGGLPFGVRNVSAYRTQLPMHMQNVPWPGAVASVNTMQVSLSLVGGTSYGNVTMFGSAGATVLTNTDIGNGDDIWLSGIYWTDDA